MRDKIAERREKEEERGVDYAAVCCPVLWTMFLLVEAFWLSIMVSFFFLLLVAISSTFPDFKLHLFHTSSRREWTSAPARSSQASSSTDWQGSSTWCSSRMFRLQAMSIPL